MGTEEVGEAVGIVLCCGNRRWPGQGTRRGAFVIGESEEEMLIGGSVAAGPALVRLDTAWDWF